MRETGRTIATRGPAADVVAHGELADGELVGRLRARLVAEGGFTVDPCCARPVRSGVAVCVYPAMTVSFRFTDWSDHVVLGWVRSSRRFVRATGYEDLYLGGWHMPDRDHVHLDLVRVMAPQWRHVAERVGRWHRQRAVFDLAEGALIPVAAT
jgi:hypothetical protein